MAVRKATAANNGDASPSGDVPVWGPEGLLDDSTVVVGQEGLTRFRSNEGGVFVPTPAQMDRVALGEAAHEGAASVALDGETQSKGTSSEVIESDVIVTPNTRTGRHKIAIVGYTSHKVQAPFNDPARPRDEWEIWGMNDLWRWLPTAETREHMPANTYDPQVTETYTFEAWYDIHLPAAFEDAGEERTSTKLLWLQIAHPFPIYLPEQLLVHIAGKLGLQPSNQYAWWKEKLPSVELFPAHDIASRTIPYFTNSVAWMTAHATLSLHDNDGRIPEGAELGLWGIDMSVATEYARQRPSCEFWLGMAAGRGVTISIPVESDLLKAAGMYGVEEDALGAKLRSRQTELDAHLAALENEKRALMQRQGEIEGGIRELTGARTQIVYQLGTWHHAVVTDRDDMGDPFDKFKSRS